MEPNATTPPNPDSLGSDLPKKYIRTFAGDMEILKEGGVPDLTPLREPTPTERLVASSPLPEVEVPAETSVLEPVPEPVAPISSEPVPATLKTYSGDFLDRMSETKASTATVLAAEQDAAQGPPQIAPQPTRSTPLYIIGGVVLLLLATGGGVFAYLQYMTITAPVSITPTVSAPILAEEQKEITGTDALLLLAIEQSVVDPLAGGAVRLLYLESTTTPKSVFSLLSVSAPDILVRNVQAEGSMAGVIHIGATQSPFFILSVLSYGDTFSGMLSWENTITRDLSALFPAYPAPFIATSTPIVASTTIATSTSKKGIVKKTTKPAPIVVPTTTLTPVFIPAFHDEVISNHDVRIYRDSSGRSILMYGYWNQSTFIIARDPSAFTEIMNRLATARTP